MTNGAPASIPDLNVVMFGLVRVVTVSTTLAVVSVLSRTLPSPGKCLSVASTPASVDPARNASLWGATVAAVYPNSRSYRPIGALAVPRLAGTTSATGARFRFTPADLSSLAHTADSSRNRDLVQPPCVRALGMVENPGPDSTCTTPPS